MGPPLFPAPCLIGPADQRADGALRSGVQDSASMRELLCATQHLCHKLRYIEIVLTISTKLGYNYYVFYCIAEGNGGRQQCLSVLDGVLTRHTLHLDKSKNMLDVAF